MYPSLGAISSAPPDELLGLFEILAAFGPRIADEVERVGVVRLCLQHFLHVLERFIRVALRAVVNAELVVDLGVLFGTIEHLLEQPDTAFEIARLDAQRRRLEVEQSMAPNGSRAFDFSERPRGVSLLFVDRRDLDARIDVERRLRRDALERVEGELALIHGRPNLTQRERHLRLIAPAREHALEMPRRLRITSEREFQCGQSAERMRVVRVEFDDALIGLDRAAESF